jgi:hypothetical protein
MSAIAGILVGVASEVGAPLIKRVLEKSALARYRETLRNRDQDGRGKGGR